MYESWVMIPKQYTPNVCTFSQWICKINRIIQAVRKHVVANESLPCGNEHVRIEESTPLGVIISALEIIQPRFSGSQIAFEPNSDRCLLSSCGGNSVEFHPSGRRFPTAGVSSHYPKTFSVVPPDWDTRHRRPSASTTYTQRSSTM